MKLLILTQAVDRTDSNLGFFHRWIEEFAKHCELVTVICLREGEHDLPPNVRVLSLGKERGSGWLMRLWRFFSYIKKYKGDYEAVFVHMNPEYIALGGRFWRKHHKKIALWYAHRSVTRRLKRAVALVDYIFTVSNDSFRVPTPKLMAVGHGIDTELFAPMMHEHSTHMRIVTTGRLAQSKHLIEMLQMLDALNLQGRNFTFTIVGAALTKEEEEYEAALRREIKERPYREHVRLLGPLPHDALPALLNAQDVFLNFASTGNMDKAGLEALAVELPVFTTNAAFRDLLGPYGLYTDERDPAQVAAALERFMNRPDRAAITSTLRHRVEEEHSLSKLIPKILAKLQS